ncbi:3-(3-hydroxy-phenyl)propionate hydroxylase [Melghirimyces profundicolus]|uniref:3-(3-hydroxy-phenyl)propionate hydroxylase n=1 Tax=Melghirimyces profundicolus TaxID=1242148 RepID=A0A2T6C8J8_9BACL|nr:FAD-dependent monooxygenase [Melghirimyces profundicolus]PTX64635.1 3-(3-hydroxy-phenyl)propionate hydroxylase [Melghirimyces profundicolus]
MTDDHYRERRSALVAGAGPVGLTAALALKRHGVPVTVLEAEPENRIRPGSRAIFVHRATLKLLEEISPSLGYTLAEKGLVWPIKRTMWKGKEVYLKKYPSPDPEKLPPFTSLPQVEVERDLHQACQEAGVEFIWNAPVREVDTDRDQVTVTTEDGTLWKSDYLIGADGARSAIRRGLDIGMEGSRSANTFIVVDVKEDPENPMPLERVFHYHHPAVGGRNVLFVPFAGGWRIDLQLFDGDDIDEYSGSEGVRKWLPKVMDDKYADRVTWVSTYRFLQVVAKAFTDPNGRVLLAGEAAHLFAPFGARGMNSGVADAIAAARAIHTALRTEDPASAQRVIRSCADERLQAAKYNRDAAGVALHHLQGRSAGMKMKRYMAASLAPMWPRLGRWLDEGPYGPKSGPPAMASKY